MPDIITEDRATEIAAMTVPDLTAALVGLDLPSLELVLHAEEAKGDAVRSTAVGAITTAIAALSAPDPTPQPDTPAPTLPTTFTAPAHVSAIYFSTGREVEVVDGVLTAPDDLSDDERLQLTRAGFVPA